MFYVIKNLRTELKFTPYDMDKLASDEEVMKRLREKIEGSCHPEYGYLLLVIQNKASSAQSDFQIELPLVEDENLLVVVTFSVLAWKGPLPHPAEKNNIIDFLATDIRENLIEGRIGHARVLIPIEKMPKGRFEYRPIENVFVFRGRHGEEIYVDKDSRVRCRCFEVKTELSTEAHADHQMTIVASIDELLISTLTVA